MHHDRSGSFTTLLARALPFAAALLVLALGSKAAALTVTQVSSASLQIDPGDSLTGMYEGYAIATGAGESYSDLWVTSSSFAGPRISLASSEDGVKHVGPIAANSTKYVFFYLNASAATVANESHSIRVFNGPTTGTALLTQNISMSATARGGNMSNKVDVVVHTPSGPGIGATLVMTVTGTTGQVNDANPNIVLTPASRTDWPANVFELESLTAAFYSNAARTTLVTQVDNSLSFTIGDQPDRYYTFIFTFRITGIKTTPTIVQPVNYIYNGMSLKHTATGSMSYQDAITTAGTIPQPTMHLTLKRSPSSVAGESITGTASTSQIEAVGNTVQHTLRITNAFTDSTVVDDYTDVFTASPATPRLVAGSISQRSWNGTTLTTTALPDAVLGITGSTWKFTSFFVVPASGYLELLYTVSYTSDTGTYTQEATAHVGSAQIDTTTQAANVTPDNAPAHAIATVADTDGDGVRNSIDQDSDNDGIADLVESGLAVDPDADADSDGVQNFRDPSSVSCTDTTPANGICDALPVSIDFDGDGIPNHRDLDSDGDGITDAYEAESGDANGDGIPDGCAPVNAGTGRCNSGVIANPRDTDNTGGDDYLDTDSDGDGISDRNEAFDSSGDGVADVSPTGVDTDLDGIDNRFDPSCTGSNCGGVTGAPVLAVLTSYRDQNQDGAPDWLQTCGDAYLTGSEACDDSNLVNTDACSNVCLRGIGVGCSGDAVCNSNVCDGGLGTCQVCEDSTTGGTDQGCSGGSPACRTSSGTNACRVCEASGGAFDDGCTLGSPRCDESAASGAGACGQCSTGADCNDANACTSNTCTNATCGNPSLAAGTACGVGDVCDGAASNPACVNCVDNPIPGADDFGCGGAAHTCDENASGGAGACVVCLADIDCDDGNACTIDDCNANTCINTSAGAGTSCGSGDVCDGAANDPECVNCVDNPLAGPDFGCSGLADVCNEGANGGAGACVECLGIGDCDDSNECTADTCSSNSCGHTPVTAGTGCGVGDVCNGPAGPACVNCADNPLPGADFGCSGQNDVCNVGALGGLGMCVECVGIGDCDDGNACTADACIANACSHDSADPGTGCGGSEVCDGAESNPVCVHCTDNPAPGVDDFGCSGTADVCDESALSGLGACVECLGDGDCDDGNACTTDACDTDTNVCGHTSLAVGLGCGGGDVCDGAASNPECVHCTDNPASGADDFGCSGTADVCNENALGGLGACVECIGVGDCDDGDDCTVDACDANVCSHPSAAAGASCGSGDVCDGDASEPECVHCTDNPTSGADDFGCSGTADVCDEGADSGLGACVECVGDGDCDDANACTADACDTDTNACGHLSLAAGLGCGSGDVCDGAANDPECVHCTDNPAPGADDFGCSGSSSADVCNESAAGGLGACVECLGDGDCDDGNACTTDACDTDENTCGHTSLDAGIGCGGGDVCDGAPTDPVCRHCVDNPTPGDDFGCSGNSELCDEDAVGGLGACVECLGDGDCNDGNDCSADLCDEGACDAEPEPLGTACLGGACDGESPVPACLTCVDDALPGDQDSGCDDDAAPTCDPNAVGGPVCVGCVGDDDCSGGSVCVEQACTACEDSAPDADQDHGCDVDAPICDENGDAPECVECLGDGDCENGTVCSPSQLCVPGCSEDDDCTITPDTPFCDTLAGACVECLDVDVCDDDNECTVDACESGACESPSVEAGSDCTDGVCDGSLISVCVTCLEDEDAGGIDSGCDADAPACDELAGSCVECDGLADCDDDNECTADACTDGSCDHLPVTPGAGCDGDGVCTSSGVCGDCIEDAAAGATDTGCTGSTPACNESANGGLGACIECDGLADCDDDNECTLDACESGTCERPSAEVGSDCTDGVCDGSLISVCVTCLEDQAPGAIDSGCDADAPACDELAGSCVECDGLADCDDDNDCTTDSCSAGSCGHLPVTPGAGCDGDGVCASGGVCGTCIEDAAPGATDTGCGGSAPACNETANGGLGACLECDGLADCDDGDECTTDACSAGSCGSTPALEGTICSGGKCDGEATPACVECLGDGDCDSGEVCGGSHTCSIGCADDDDCAGAPATPICGSDDSCVECGDDDDCDGMLVCSDDGACGRPDSDGDGYTDEDDADDDDDGVADDDELEGADLSQDSDDDGVPDYADPDEVTCADTTPADGACDALPPALDRDGDGVPNHLDRDSDDDGLTDAYETGALDDDGDGVPDACLPVTSSGECNGGSVAAPPNSDDPADADPDFLDTDSDGDGLSDRDEAFDTDGDGDADTAPAGADGDGDGLDDAFDPDCASAGDCGGVIGVSVGGALSAAEDANDDGTADWLQVCGDAYQTGEEPCDDGDLDDEDACSNACLLGNGEGCDGDDECVSELCDGTLDTCQGCVDDEASGRDSGCGSAAPTCTGRGGDNSCVVCADSEDGDDEDDGCSSSAPMCDEDASSGRGACGDCVDDDDCSDGNACTRDRCRLGSCSNPSLPAGTACSTGVCSGLGSAACVECVDDGDCGVGLSCDPASSTCVGPDSDDDGLRDAVDVDDDGDGIPDEVETDDDLDGDGTPNRLDDDADGDGLDDLDEGNDASFDGAADRQPSDHDSDGDGLDDAFDPDCARASDCDGVLGVSAPIPDLDGDGDASYLDADDDGDGRSTPVERADAEAYEGPAADPTDIDQDGRPNWYDADTDGDGASDMLEHQDGGDVDDNGILDALDPLFRAPDSDGDGLLDVIECPPPAYPENDDCPDSDGDGKPDYLDPDDDDDGLPTRDEAADRDGDGKPDDARDSDGDGIPDYLERDSDGDGLEDGEEVDEYGTDPTIVDTDGDGVDDGQEVEDGTDPLQPPETYSVQGGAFFGCATGSVGSERQASSDWLWSALGLFTLVCARRRTPRAPLR